MKTAVIGSFVVDLMARTTHLPKPGETVKGSLFRMGAGGKGYNQAVAAKKAGADLFFATKVGQDDFATVLKNSMEKNGITNHVILESSTESTAVALITVDENSGQNDITVVVGASGTFSRDEVNAVFDRMGNVDFLLLQLEINMDAIKQIAMEAKKRGIKVILNPAPAQVLDAEIYPLLFALTPNEVEAEILSGLPYRNKEDVKAIASEFQRRGVENVVITLGKNGAFLLTSDDRNRFYDNYSDIAVLDATGAGDAFNGGLLASLGEGLDIEDAVAFANVVSNLSVTKLGTSDSMPTRSEIDEFIKKHQVE